MLLEAGRSLSVADILVHVNVRRTRLEAMLKILEVEGAVERSDGGWRRTLKPWSYDQERVERVTVERRAEQAAMLEFQRTDGCLMEFLRRRLDDPGAVPCGRCMNCTGGRPDPTVDRGLADAARTFLRSRDIELAPRLMWPPGLDALRGRIDPELTLRPGRSLSVYNDGGWGELVRSGKQHDGFFSDQLVEASMQLIRRWRPDPPPTWVTCVPSTSRPDLVPSFAERLAAALGLPFRAVIRKRQAAAPQKDMENSVQQLMNVRQAFEVEAGSALEGPVLLLDDIVDSRWTLTVVGMELLRAGSGPVHPFVLAQAVST